jgi:hypothetical protein
MASANAELFLEIQFGQFPGWLPSSGLSDSLDPLSLLEESIEP